MNVDDYIEINPGVRSGKPCFKGTRIAVHDVLEYLAGGMGEAELLDNFPALTPDHLRAALLFAAARERRLAGLLAWTLKGGEACLNPKVVFWAGSRPSLASAVANPAYAACASA